MSLATASSPMPAGGELNSALREAVTAVEALFADARHSVAARVTVQGRPIARVFDREEDAMSAVTHGKINPNDVIVIRYEGPRGGPGMREMLASPAR